MLKNEYVLSEDFFKIPLFKLWLNYIQERCDSNA